MIWMNVNMIIITIVGPIADSPLANTANVGLTKGVATANTEDSHNPTADTSLVMYSKSKGHKSGNLMLSSL